MKEAQKMKKINCKRCVYYYVTWESVHPHGCKAFGFKSKIIPSQEVKNSSGKECAMYEVKKPKS